MNNVIKALAETIGQMTTEAEKTGQTQVVNLLDGCDWTYIDPEHPERGRFRYSGIEITVEPATDKAA